MSSAKKRSTPYHKRVNGIMLSNSTLTTPASDIPKYTPCHGMNKRNSTPSLTMHSKPDAYAHLNLRSEPQSFSSRKRTETFRTTGNVLRTHKQPRNLPNHDERSISRPYHGSVYLDDILIFTSDLKTHREIL